MKTSGLKKCLSLFLSIIMIFTMVPAAVFTLAAEESYPVMMAVNSATSTGFYKYYNRIYTITVLDKIDDDAINGALESWDMSADKDGSVRGWVYLNEEATAAAGVNRYDAYLAGKGGVAVNPKSTHLFYLFESLVAINNPENLKTSGVTSFYMMFSKCYNLKSVDLSSWDVSSVTSLQNMFEMSLPNNSSIIPALESVNLSNWDTSNVTNMSALFYNCSSLDNLDLSSFNTEKVTNMANMFYRCMSLENIYIGDGWTVESVNNANAMFNCCYAIVGGKEIYDEDFQYIPPGKEYAKTKEEGGFLTYKAPEAPENYKVTYKFIGDIIPEGVTAPDGGTFEEGTTVTVADASSAEHYIFSGWSTDDATVDADGNFVINDDVEFVGSWTKLYKVEYKYDEDFDVPEDAPEIPDVEMWYAPGVDVPVYGIPYVHGYVFVGWNTEDAEVIGDSFIMPENDVVLEGFYKIPVEGIEIIGGDMTINIGGEEVKVEVYVNPEYATFKGVIFESGDESIVEVDQNGVLTPKSEGKTTITITSVDDPTKTDTVEVTVKIPVTDITVDKTQINLNKGETDKITVTEVKPSQATNKGVTYESSDESVVTVDEEGNIVAVGDGTAIITVTSKDNDDVFEKVTVTVKTPVTELTVPEKEIYIELGEEKNLEASVNEDATHKELIYDSDTPGVIKVDNDGNIVAVGEGTATVTITSKDNPGISETVTITVYKKYKVTYAFVGDVIPEGVADPDAADYISGSEVTVEDNASAEGYVFSGWSTEDNADIADGKFIIYNDVHFVGSWSKLYNVTYEYEGEVPEGAPALPVKESFTAGTTVGVKDVPSVEGYTFTGWTTSDAEVTDGSFTMPAKDVVLKGKFEKIIVNVEDVIIPEEKIELEIGDKETINVTVTPDNATNKDVEYKSSDEGVVKVDENGNIEAVGEGNATITVTSKSDPTKSDTITVTVKKPVVNVEDVIIPEEKIELEIGDKETINVTVTPDNATNKDVEYKSSDEGVVKVDENGNIEAVGEGTVTITVTSKSDPTKSDTITVTVKKPVVNVEDVIIPEEKIELEIGDKETINVTVTPDNATNKDVEYKSSDEGVVKVDENGNIEAVGVGTVTITVTSKSDPTKSDTITVTVKKPVVNVEYVVITKDSITLLVGDKNKVPVTVTPDNATNKEVEYTSSNESIVKVDENGVIEAVGEGTAVITVISKSDPTKRDTITITVKKPQPQEPTYTITVPDSITLVSGENKPLGVTVTPDDGRINPVYTSADESIVKVDANGNVTAIGVGITTISVDFGGGDIRVIPVTVIAVPAGTIPTKHHVCFGKTDGIGWYEVSVNGGDFFPQGPNSTLEVDNGSVLVVRVQDMWIDDEFTFYVNGDKVPMDPGNTITVVVDGYMLIGALSMDVEVPDVDESLTLFEKLLNAIKEFFRWLFRLD